MNMSGIIKGGLVAGLLINVSEYVLNMMVIPVPEGAGGSIGFWVVYAFVMGLLTAYLYALIRPRCGAGPKTGVCAGLLVWALHTLLPAGGMWNMGMAPGGPAAHAGLDWRGAGPRRRPRGHALQRIGPWDRRSSDRHARPAGPRTSHLYPQR